MAVQAALGVQVEAAVGRRHAQGPLADARLRGRVVERAEAQLLEPRRQLRAREGGERERLGADLPAPGRQVRLHEPRAMVKGLLAHRLHRGGQAHRGKPRLRERHAAQTTHALRQRHLLEVVQRVERPLVHIRAPGGHLVGAAGNHQAVQVPPVPRHQRPAVGGEGLVGGIDGHALQVRQPEGLRVERLDGQIDAHELPVPPERLAPHREHALGQLHGAHVRMAFERLVGHRMGAGTHPIGLHLPYQLQEHVMAVQAALGVQVEAAVGRRHAQGPLADARLRGRVVERAEAQLLEPRRQLRAREGGERERLGADLPAPGRQVRLHEPRAMVKGLLAHRLHRGGQAHRGKPRLRERHAAQTTHALRQRHLLEVVQRVERPLVHIRAPGGHLVGAAGNHQAVQVPPVPRHQRPAVGGEGLVGGIDGHALQVRQPEGLRVERLDERPERHVGHRRVRERVSLQPHQGHGELHLRERPALQEHGGVDLVKRR